jgi:hypothetical protein
METGYHSSANLPRTCPQHLGTKPGSVAHGNLFFGSGANLMNYLERFIVYNLS